MHTGAAALPACCICPCMPLRNTVFSRWWQPPQVSGTWARATRLSGSDFGWMLCVPWHDVQVGAARL